MNKINFYKNGELLYSLYKLDNFYVLKNNKTNETKIFNDIPPELENLLPEGINKEIYAIKHNISIHNKFKLLQYLDDTFGRISTNNVIKNEVPFDLKINSYEESIKYIEDFKIEDSLLESLEFSIAPKENKINLSYLSGQQPKATIIVNNNNIRFSTKKEHSNAILKYSNKNFYLINVIENMFLNFARFELNFDVMPSFLLIDRQLRKPEFLRDTVDTFITKRFDNKRNEYFELNALLGYTSEEKYDIPLEEIFEKLQKYLDKKELEKLAKYYYFNYLIGNGDSHAKNFSIIKENNKYKLAPLYDVVNTHIYGFKYPLGISLYKNNDTEFEENELISLLSKYIDTNKLLNIKAILQKKIKDYINKTPFNIFEKGEIKKNQLINFLKERQLLDNNHSQKQSLTILHTNIKDLKRKTDEIYEVLEIIENAKDEGNSSVSLKDEINILKELNNHIIKIDKTFNNDNSAELNEIFKKIDVLNTKVINLIESISKKLGLAIANEEDVNIEKIEKQNQTKSIQNYNKLKLK